MFRFTEWWSVKRAKDTRTLGLKWLTLQCQKSLRKKKIYYSHWKSQNTMWENRLFDGHDDIGRVKTNVNFSYFFGSGPSPRLWKNLLRINVTKNLRVNYWSPFRKAGLRNLMGESGSLGGVVDAKGVPWLEGLGHLTWREGKYTDKPRDGVGTRVLSWSGGRLTLEVDTRSN